MAKDKAVDSAVLNAGLTVIADAIREKAGTSDLLAFPAGMAEAIAAISSGGGDAENMIHGLYTPAEDVTKFFPEGMSRIGNLYNNWIFAIGVYSLNEQELNDSAVCLGTKIYGGWTIRCMGTAEGTYSSRMDVTPFAGASFTNAVLQAGITYKYVMIGFD